MAQRQVRYPTILYYDLVLACDDSSSIVRDNTKVMRRQITREQQGIDRQKGREKQQDKRDRKLKKDLYERLF